MLSTLLKTVGWMYDMMENMQNIDSLETMNENNDHLKKYNMAQKSAMVLNKKYQHATSK